MALESFFKISITINIHGVIFQKTWIYVAEASLSRGVALAIKPCRQRRNGVLATNLVKRFVTSRCLLLPLPAFMLPIIFLFTFSASVAASSSSAVRTLDRIAHCLCPLIRQCIRVHCFRLPDPVGLCCSVPFEVHCHHCIGRVSDRQGETRQLE
jgi:hypothetical protein